MKITAILLLAGTGSRFKETIPKQFINLDGKKIYLHSLDTFGSLNIFDEILLMVHPDFIGEVGEDIKEYRNVKVFSGGATRQQSSYLALKNTSADYVVIHDAARPFITKKIILDNIESAIKYRAVNTCIKSMDTLVEKDEYNFIKKIPDREYILRGQTPQSFEYRLILTSHERALKKGITNATDDAQLVLDQTNPYIVEGDQTNIKITTKLDLILAQEICKINKQLV